jgi:hypothetical protein
VRFLLSLSGGIVFIFRVKHLSISFSDDWLDWLLLLGRMKKFSIHHLLETFIAVSFRFDLVLLRIPLRLHNGCILFFEILSEFLGHLRFGTGWTIDLLFDITLKSSHHCFR